MPRPPRPNPCVCRLCGVSKPSPDFPVEGRACRACIAARLRSRTGGVRRWQDADTPEFRALIAEHGVLVARQRTGRSAFTAARVLARMREELTLPPDTPEEQWRWVPGLDTGRCRVAVSSLGQVRVERHGALHAPRVYTHGARGYPTFQARCRWFRVHHMVLRAFVGPRPTPNYFACHFNDVPTDNRRDNLRWDTVRNNVLDRFRNRGTLCGLTWDQVRQVYTADGVYAKDLAKQFGVSKGAIEGIRNGVSYREVTKHLKRGEARPRLGADAPRTTVMTADMVARARRLVAGGASIPEATRRLALPARSESAVRFAVNGRSWSHLLDPPPVPSQRARDLCTVPVADPNPVEHATEYAFALG